MRYPLNHTFIDGIFHEINYLLRISSWKPPNDKSLKAIQKTMETFKLKSCALDCAKPCPSGFSRFHGISQEFMGFRVGL